MISWLSLASRRSRRTRLRSLRPHAGLRRIETWLLREGDAQGPRFSLLLDFVPLSGAGFAPLASEQDAAAPGLAIASRLDGVGLWDGRGFLLAEASSDLGRWT